MGKVEKVIYEKLIDPIADRNCNRVLVYRAPNDEVTIHFRNLKIVLHTREEQGEWSRGFREALEKLGDRFQDDI